jgi:chromatin segregation and condensation protein Rec8/ScpA/Scc1 (kleisin family)
VAGEFLVMAATLAHIKSRLLLPRTEAPTETGEGAEEQGDPRAELVRRLLEYQKYKDVARQLAENPLLGREVFARRITPAAAAQVESAALAEVSVYRLIEALDRVLKALEPRVGHEVVRDQLTLSAAMQGITARLRPGERITFIELFEGQRSRGSVVVTFLALLEMVKLRLLRVHQDEGKKDIWVSAEAGALESGTRRSTTVSTPEKPATSAPARRCRSARTRSSRWPRHRRTPSWRTSSPPRSTSSRSSSSPSIGSSSAAVACRRSGCGPWSSRSSS